MNKGNKDQEITIAEICFQKVLLLTANDDFFNSVVAIKRKYGIPEDGISPNNNLGDRFYNCLNDIALLRVKYNLSELYSAPLIWLILYANSPRENLDDYINFPIYKTEKNAQGQDTLYLAIYPEMNVKDIENNWKQISNKVKEVYGYGYIKRKLRKNLIRDYCIVYFRKQGLSYKKIAETIKKFYNYGIDYGYDRPGIAINRLKRDAKTELKRLTKNKK